MTRLRLALRESYGGHERSVAALKACSSLLIWDVRTDLSAGQDEAKAGRDRPLAAGAISRVAHSITQPPANVDPQPPSYMGAWGWVWAIGLLGSWRLALAGEVGDQAGSVWWLVVLGF